MANSIIAQTAQEARIHRKGEGGYLPRLWAAVPMRLLVEVHGEHVAFGYGVQIGDRHCMQALRSGHGVL